MTPAERGRSADAGFPAGLAAVVMLLSLFGGLGIEGGPAGELAGESGPAESARGMEPAESARGMEPAEAARGMEPAEAARGMEPAEAARGMGMGGPPLGQRTAEGGGGTGGGTPSSWWDLNWTYRMKLTFDNSGQSENLTDFPVLVTLDPSNFNYTLAEPDGADLRFIDDDGATELSYEFEDWNTLGDSHIWVNVTRIDGGSAEDHIWLYYNNSRAGPAEAPTAVWNENYIAVWHLNDGYSTGDRFYQDSTANDRDGTLHDADGGSQAVDAVVGGGFDFDGDDDDEIEALNVSGYLKDSMTISGWARPEVVNHASHDGFFGVRQGGTDSFYILQLQNSANLECRFCNSTGINFEANLDSASCEDTWIYVSLTYDGGTLVSYLNGSVGYQNGLATGSFSDSNYPFYMGSDGLNKEMQGTLDEVRVSNVSRSADWIRAEYLSMTGDLVSYGPHGVKWWDPDWSCRMKLSFDNLAQTEDLVNFPVLVVLNSSNFNYSRALPDGADLRFIDPDGFTVLSYEIEEWNASGDSYVWVNVTLITGSSSTDYIWMYYDNPDAISGESAPEVWDGDFRGVWHLDETSKTPGTYNDTLDSTSNGNHGEAVNGTMLDVKGKVDGADLFDNDNDHIDITSSPSLNISGDITIGAWIKRNDDSGYSSILQKTDPSMTWDYAFYIDVGKKLYFYSTGGSPIEISSAESIGDLSWHYAVVTRNGGIVRFYIDGSDAGGGGAMSGALGDTGTTVRMGYSGEDNSAFDGSLDEVRLSNTARSPDWIRAEYLSMNGAFVKYGQQESNAWWEPDWRYRMKLTFDNLAQSEDLADFPVLVRLNPSNFNYSRAQPDGDDLRFVDADGEAELSYEIESWNTSGESCIWVNVTEITGSSFTDFIWMYYGNPTASDGQDQGGTFDANYVAVWHLNENGTGTRYDSTSKGNDGTPQNYEGDEATDDGKVGGADVFDAVDDEISIPVGGSYSTYTTSLWVKPIDPDSWSTLIGEDNLNVLDIRNGGAGVDAWKYGVWESGGIIYGNSRVTQYEWNYISVARSGPSVKYYLNGEYDGPSTVTIDMVFDFIGNTPNDEAFGGTLDEIRVSDTARSADWIRAEYLSMGGAFVDYGGEECVPYVAKPLGDLSMPEDGVDDSIDLSAVFNDCDTPLLNFSYESEGRVNVQIDGQGKVTMAPPQDWHGVEHITFIAEDDHLNVSEEFNLTVLPVDDPPVIAPLADIDVDQGTPVYIQAVGNDTRDGEAVLFYDNTTLLDIDPSFGNASLVPGNIDVGSYQVSVWVQDENNSRAHTNFTIIIRNVNDAPEILSLGGVDTAGASGPGSILDPVNLTAVEDVRTNWTAACLDLDQAELGCDEGLIFSLHTDDPQVNITCDPATGNISCLPVQSDIDRTGGTLTGWLGLTDSGGLEDRAYFTVDLEEVNEPPTRPDFTWNVVGTQDNAGDDPGYDVAFTGIPSLDEEGDELTYTWDFGDGAVYEDPGGLHVVITFPAADTYHVSLSVEDEAGNKVNRTRLVIVSGQFEEPEPDEREEEEDGAGEVDETPEVEPPEGGGDGTVDDPSHGGLKDSDVDGISDSDGDGLPDRWEREHGFDPFDPADAFLDSDEDGISNLDEYCGGTDPSVQDATSDGVEEDGGEVPDGAEPAGDDVAESGAGDDGTVPFALILCIPLLVICLIAAGLVVWSRMRHIKRWEEVFSMEPTGAKPMVVTLPPRKVERPKYSALLELKALMDGKTPASAASEGAPRAEGVVPKPLKGARREGPAARGGKASPPISFPRALPVDGKAPPAKPALLVNGKV